MLFYGKFLIILSGLCIFCHSRVFPLKERKVNPVTSFICTILLEVALMERLTIKERMEYIVRVLRWEDRQAIGKALRIIRRNIKKRLPC